MRTELSNPNGAMRDLWPLILAYVCGNRQTTYKIRLVCKRFRELVANNANMYKVYLALQYDIVDSYYDTISMRYIAVSDIEYRYGTHKRHIPLYYHFEDKNRFVYPTGFVMMLVRWDFSKNRPECLSRVTLNEPTFYQVEWINEEGYKIHFQKGENGIWELHSRDALYSAYSKRIDRVKVTLVKDEEFNKRARIQ